MSWTPHHMLAKTHCRCCGTTSYIHEIRGDCSWTEGFIFCSETCKTTYRWRNKFKIYEYQDTEKKEKPK